MASPVVSMPPSPGLRARGHKKKSRKKAGEMCKQSDARESRNGNESRPARDEESMG
ncbi:hypothetical protein [Paraburkholderia sp. J63]|uniref:hypothetical protein n=1 Tax=Paraburkholderia sp. J63 TaxID=2805434 RepID=UPI002ABE7BAE|nr:hypothetical protein [Paraburkholderia sp. J63]